MAIITGKIFNQFDPLIDPNTPSDDIVPDKQEIYSGMWSSNAGTLSSMFLDATQSASSGIYYLNILNQPSNSITTTPEVQFAITYGHKYGSGSLILNQQYPTRAIYSQYKNILLDPSDQFFTIAGVNKTHVLILNMARARVKDKIDPGNWQLNISGSGPTHNTLYSFIDDSGQNLNPSTGKSGRIYNIVSGTIAAGSASGASSIGLLYPDVGLMLFDPDTLSSSYGIVCNNSGSNLVIGNHQNFYYALTASLSSSNGFIARNDQYISSTHYFVRVKNREYNFSNNPTFTSGSYGDFWNQSMVKNPTVYITTVGLYNDNNELLAVAKLSQPLKKTFNREATVRIKLDY